MRFLQKIKLLVAHCATAAGGKCSTLIRPLRRRRKKPHEFSKFRRLLHGAADCSVGADERRNSEELKQRLVDLFFVSEEGGGDEGGCGGGAERTRADQEGLGARGGSRRWRFGSAVGLRRCRLLRQAWRPVLVAIPEND